MAVLLVCAVLSVGWLTLGVVVTLAAHAPGAVPGLPAGHGSWARGVLAGVSRSQPLAPAVLDSVLGLVLLGAGAAALVVRDRARPVRLLGLALVTVAGAFSLQSAAAGAVVGAVTGSPLAGVLPQRVLPVAAAAAYATAVLASCSPTSPGSRRGALRRPPAVAAVGVTAALAAVPAPLSLRCVLVMGFAVPLTGVAAAHGRLGAADGGRLPAQARWLAGVLAAIAVVGGALAVLTALPWPGGWTGPVLVDAPGPPAAGQQTAVLFWSARLSGAVVAGAVLVAARRTAGQPSGRGIAVALVTALVGGGYLAVQVAVGRAAGPGLGTAVATVGAAAAFLPACALADHAVDRLLYGRRPAPYGVLAQLAALPRPTGRDVPDLARVVEAVGRGLGATTCRLVVHRPGLRDRSFSWTRPGEEEAEELVEVAVRHRGERVGTLAVDPAAVAGLQGQRAGLLEAVAGSLAVVLQAARSGTELERQLRAALAHAAGIATARRRVVAETDRERRRIERDLHDGAQHQLVSSSLVLGLVEHHLGAGRPAEARAQLDRFAQQLDEAEAVLDRTATGVSSPVLAERGLVAALHAEYDGGLLPVTLDTSGVAPGLRAAPEVEAAVYFCCLEAVGNARKHAPGAPVEVRLAVAGAHLGFTIRDEGPGWDVDAVSGAPGRGLRNVVARIGSVGGRVDVRSAPGAGTTVEGRVPLPGGAAPGGAPAPVLPLLGDVRAAVRIAGDLYRDTPHAERLRALAGHLAGPVRVAVVGPPGAGAADPAAGALAAALSADPALQATRIGVPPGPGDPLADARLLLLRAQGPWPEQGGGPDPDGDPGPVRPTQTIGVFLDPEAAGGRPGTDVLPPAVRRRCRAVVPVAEGLVRAAAVLDDADHRALLRTLHPAGPGAAGVVPRELVERLGEDGVRCAVELVRTGAAPTRAALVEALRWRSGLSRLREVVVTVFVGRAPLLAARTVLGALEALVRTAPPPGDRAPLLYALDRIRSGATELAELDLLDALYAGEVELPDDDRPAAERLLGGRGGEAWARLGCPPQAGREELARAAARDLARWQQTARNPASATATRAAAELLAGTCRRLSPPPAGGVGTDRVSG
ncbi:ATP-binding protein [Geodermatophilus sp. URMC 62]|uniref:ATP-binding protein n=1 Tax=Geodermatophilus sp. URMC 62 TaxID=3423414 RepID=UPI00406D41F7